MEYLSHIVVTSQSMKKIGAPTPLLICLQARKCPTLLKQLWLISGKVNEMIFFLQKLKKTVMVSHFRSLENSTEFSNYKVLQLMGACCT
jgi:hypothetical protein